MTTATTTIVAMIPMLVSSFVAGVIPTGVGFNPFDNEEMGEPRPMPSPRISSAAGSHPSPAP